MATTLSAYLNAILLLRNLVVTRIYRPCADWYGYIGRIVAANAAMSAFLYYFVDAGLWLNWNAAQRGLNLAATIGLAIIVYGSSLLVLGLRPRHIGLRESAAA